MPISPLAIGVLRTNPLAQGDMHEGDLPTAMLTKSGQVWSEFPNSSLLPPEVVDVPPALKGHLIWLPR
ncbi:contact-dependent growth inhibition system immunity protein [Streptomyces sp. NPDC086081]|uniref:contact-dependent growth inhibition system immunity protein n=1 Tax=Streptomyces sp. NPDC086081 TaxID=3365749 RepID=UPI003827E6A4